MHTILKKQNELQNALAEKADYPLPSPAALEGQSVGEVREYLRMMQTFLNDEIEEIILSLSDGDRKVNKPWSSRFARLNDKLYEFNDETREEGIDMLCFAMNIVLACGVTPENIEEYYDNVLSKNRSRIQNDY